MPAAPAAPDAPATDRGPLGFTVGPLLGTALYQLDGQLPYLVTLLVYVPLLLFTWMVRVRRPERIEDDVSS